MKFLIVGLGSMGKRRIRNLQHLQAGELLAYDPREDRREEAKQRYGVATFTEFGAAMEAHPDALIISTPPDRHIDYALAAARANLHFFTEASVVDDRMDELINICSGKRIVAAPSCTMRFQPSVRTIKDLITANTIGPILHFTYHSGQYLPDWHPWEDYRTYYVARRETGACREIVPFELTWLTWLFGDVEKLSCIKAKLSKLAVDIDDVYQMIMRFESGALGHLLVDVIARVPYRSCRFLSEEGVIEWAWAEKKVKVFTAGDGKWTEHPEPEQFVEKGYVAAENMYIEEMNCFLRAIRGEQPYPYTFVQDKRILDLLLAAEKSSDEGKHVGAQTHSAFVQ